MRGAEQQKRLFVAVQLPDAIRAQLAAMQQEVARVRWSDPAMRVDRLVRGCTPAPGAWTEFRGERVKIGPVTPTPDVADLAPGELRVAKDAVWVGTATHAIRLGEVKAQGKRMMPAGDWSRGVRVEPGERLG